MNAPFKLQAGDARCRAYSLLNIKAFDDDERVITGVATTPTPDRMGDIVDPLGVKFKNPLPLLWQHDSRSPVGTVKFGKPTEDGIPFEARLPKIADDGPLKDRVDTAWGEVKHKLVRGVSIGFRALEYSFMDDGGIRFVETEVLELSLVTIPANADATIQTIKSIDTEIRSASTGEKTASGSDRSAETSAGVTARKATIVVKATEARHTMKKTIAEQISEFEATRAAKDARMTAIMDDAAEKGITLDAAQKEEYDTLGAEVKEIDDHLVRLRDREKANRAAAVAAQGGDQRQASESRSGVRVEVMARKLAPGVGFARYIGCLASNRFSRNDAADFAKQRFPDQPELEMIIRAAVASGSTTDTTWASPLVQLDNLASEFIDFLRPATILGRIPGLRSVPFNIKIPRATAGASLGWVGEGSPKPISSLAFDSIELRFAKAAGIVVLNDELIRFSRPNADVLVRDDLVKALAMFLDDQFVDPSVAAVTGVNPASVTNGVTAIVASGTTADAFRTDFGLMLTEFLEANLSVDGLVLLMKSTRAAKLGLMRNSLGIKEFPDINAKGGSIEGFPVITSEGVPAQGDSPTDGDLIIGIVAPEVLLADEGGIEVDSSREASLQMDSAPDSPQSATTVYQSLWQTNKTAIKVERIINWAKRRAEAVQYIASAKYN